MFCRKCGAKNEETAVNCVGCDAPLGAVSVKSYLVWSILVTVLCCLPLGIPAIVYSCQVNSKAAAGDLEGATKSAAQAKKWCWIALGLGLVSQIVWVAITMAGALANFPQPQ